jgi:hypothetical protein
VLVARLLVNQPPLRANALAAVEALDSASPKR